MFVICELIVSSTRRGPGRECCCAISLQSSAPYLPLHTHVSDTARPAGNLVFLLRSLGTRMEWLKFILTSTHRCARCFHLATSCHVAAAAKPVTATLT